MKSLLFVFFLFVVGCGSAGKEQAEKSTMVQSPVWETDVEDAAYHFYLSVTKTLLRTNQPLRAATTIKHLYRLKPRSPEPPFLMGLAFMAMNQYDEAIRMFDDAINKDDDYAQAWSMKGGVLNLVGRHVEATRAHRQAVAIDETNSGFYNNLGFSYYLQGKPKSAIGAYRKSLELDPGSRRVHNNLGFALGEVGALEKAILHFKIAGRPDQVNNNIGFVFETRGDFEKAYEYYSVALQQNPDLTEAHENLSRVCKRLKRPVPIAKTGKGAQQSENGDQLSPDNS